MEKYSGLTHNPFASTPGALGEIWAIGFRNPYTFDIDKVTENMYVSDVGQHDWAEIEWLSLLSCAREPLQCALTKTTWTFIIFSEPKT